MTFPRLLRWGRSIHIHSRRGHPYLFGPKSGGGLRFRIPQDSRGLPAGRDPQFLAGLSQVVIDGVNRKIELDGNGLGRVAGEQQAEDFAFAIGQACHSVSHDQLINSRTKGMSPVWRCRFMRSASRISRTFAKHAFTSSLMTT